MAAGLRINYRLVLHSIRISLSISLSRETHEESELPVGILRQSRDTTANKAGKQAVHSPREPAWLSRCVEEGCIPPS